MTKYDPVICKNLRENFTTVWKRIQNYESARALPNDEKKINKYINDIVEAINKVSTYYRDLYLSESEEVRVIIKDFYKGIIDKLFRAFKILNVTYQFKGIYFEQIDKNLITQIEIETEEQSEEGVVTSIASGSSGPSVEQTKESSTEQAIENTTTSSAEQGATLRVTVEQTNNSDSEDTEIDLSDFFEGEVTQNPINMPQTKADFIKLAGPILNYKYDGNPTKLQTFLTDVELVEELAEPEQADLCFKLINSKLEGRALEAMPDEYQAFHEKYLAAKN